MPTRPLTLGQLEALFTRARPIFDVLDMNFSEDGYDEDEMQDFVIGVDSEFHPELGRLYRSRFSDWAAEHRSQCSEDSSL